MLGFSQLECCAGVRGKWFSRKDAAGNADCWPTTVEVPQHSLAEKRRCKLADDYKYNDGEIQIDRTGLHTLRNGSSRSGGSQKGAVWSEMLKASRQFPEDEDDCLSVASTFVGDDHSEASSVRSFRSAGSRRSMDDFVAEVPMPSTRSTGSIKGSTGISSKPTNRRPVRFENIRKVAVVGKGNSGIVWRCIDKSNCDPLALKEVPLDDDEEKTKMAVRELVTMYGVDHAGVVTCHEVFYSRGSFQMVLEYMDGGSLLDAMRRARDSPARGGGGLTPGALAVIGRSVASALEMLHEVLEVVHRDVKPGNILLTSQGTVKLADLGICTPPGSVQDAVEASSGSEGGCETPATEWIGTVTYMSPERLVGDPYSFKADMWSLGVVLVEAAVGRYPLSGAGESLEFWDLLDRVVSEPCASRFVEELGPEWEGVARVAAACLDKDAAHRPRARDLKDSDLLRAPDPRSLARWVQAHLPAPHPPTILHEADMWA